MTGLARGFQRTPTRVAPLEAKMHPMTAFRRTFGIAALILLLFTGACNSLDNAGGLSLSGSPFEVDPSFREFHTILGGEAILGPAIAEIQVSEHLRAQFTANAMMVLDTRADPKDRFSLYPLGRLFGVEEAPSPPPPDAGDRYINGHLIHEDFYPLYLKLGGARYAGLPLTNARYNPTYARLEQYFENVGFVILDADPEGRATLMRYGAFHCEACGYPYSPSSAPQNVPVLRDASARTFKLSAARLGSEFTGTGLTDVYQAEDGAVEVIYEYLVLYIDPDRPDQTFVRPAMLMIGFPVQEPVAPMNNPAMAFVSIDGEKGHNVPHVFLDYLARHGGLDVAGLPITELGLLQEGIFRQCFTNLCLDFYLDPPRPEREIQPAAIGQVYKGRYYDPFVEESFSSTQALGEVTMQVWESRPLINSEETQELFVRLSERDEPLERWEPILTIVYPDGNSDLRRFPPTASNGISQLQVGPIQAPNGTLIPYQVCIESPGNPAACVHEAYLIWGNP